MNIQTERLAFNEALAMLIEQYQRQNVSADIMANDMFYAGEEILHGERRRDEWDAMHGSR